MDKFLQEKSKYKKTVIYQTLCGILLLLILFSYNLNNSLSDPFESSNNQSMFIGVNMKGKFTSLNYERFQSDIFPSDYYEKSFQLMKNLGMNHVRYVFYWEAYVKNPELFISELEKFSSAADKFGLNAIYDNHQFHTSSTLDKRGSGFPEFLIDPSKYPYDSSNSNKTDLSVNNWWLDWWHNKIKDSQKNKGWNLQADFLKTVVNLVDNHSSTLGYEILNEPKINNSKQLPLVGKYYKFMVNQLREKTNKSIILDMTIPIKFSDPNLNLTAAKMAKIIPKNQKNLIFKISLYGLPDLDKYQKRKLDLLTNTSHIAKVPLYVGEWNDVTREEIANSGNFDINRTASDLLQNESDSFIKEFRNMKLWGWAFWNWNYVNTPPDNFNLVTVEGKDIIPTKYYGILRDSLVKYYPNSSK